MGVEEGREDARVEAGAARTLSCCHVGAVGDDGEIGGAANESGLRRESLAGGQEEGKGWIDRGPFWFVLYLSHEVYVEDEVTL